MKSYEEDTASMLNKYILGNYYTHILVSFWREIEHLNAVHVTEFSSQYIDIIIKCRSQFIDNIIKYKIKNHLNAVYVTGFS